MKLYGLNIEIKKATIGHEYTLKQEGSEIESKTGFDSYMSALTAAQTSARTRAMRSTRQGARA